MNRCLIFRCQRASVSIRRMENDGELNLKKLLIRVSIGFYALNESDASSTQNAVLDRESSEKKMGHPNRLHLLFIHSNSAFNFELYYRKKLFHENQR